MSRHLGLQVSAYVDRRLDASALRAFDQHLVACQVCCYAVEQERRLLTSLRHGAMPGLSEGLHSMLLELGAGGSGGSLESLGSLGSLGSLDGAHGSSGAKASGGRSESGTSGDRGAVSSAPRPLVVRPVSRPVPTVPPAAPALHRSPRRAAMFAGLAAGASAAAAIGIAVAAPTAATSVSRLPSSTPRSTSSISADPVAFLNANRLAAPASLRLSERERP